MRDYAPIWSTIIVLSTESSTNQERRRYRWNCWITWGVIPCCTCCCMLTISNTRGTVCRANRQKDSSPKFAFLDISNDALSMARNSKHTTIVSQILIQTKHIQTPSYKSALYYYTYAMATHEEIVEVSFKKLKISAIANTETHQIQNLFPPSCRC